MKATSPHLVFTVTNDLNLDQRMQRICHSLSKAGYNVTLVGVQRIKSTPLKEAAYQQVRLPLKAQSGKLFYIQFNLLLYRWLNHFVKQNTKSSICLCAIDLDTIIPVWRVANKHQIKKAYDAHELFTELTEVKRRPAIFAVWKLIEQLLVPKFKFGYTVNHFISNELERRYHVKYEVIRNLPRRNQVDDSDISNLPFELPKQFFLHQGAVNEGRAFDSLIPAVKHSPLPLVIIGDGNYFDQVKALIHKEGVADKLLLTGALNPDILRKITPLAFAGLTLFDKVGLNQYYSLANRFFDYIQAGIPQLCVAYPEYAAINQEYEIAHLIEDVSTKSILAGLNNLYNDPVLYQNLKVNAGIAAAQLCWEAEEQRLLAFWQCLVPLTII